MQQQKLLFVDSSKVSLKIVLLHNDHKFHQHGSLCYSMQETYQNFKFILQKLQNAMDDENICGDLEVIGYLSLALQLGCRKYCCFLCESVSRDRKEPL